MFTAVGEAIRTRREELGLTILDLADRLGTTQQSIYRWESGQAIPRADKWRRLAEALDATWRVELLPS